MNENANKEMNEYANKENLYVAKNDKERDVTKYSNICSLYIFKLAVSMTISNVIETMPKHTSDMKTKGLIEEAMEKTGA